MNYIFGGLIAICVSSVLIFLIHSVAEHNKSAEMNQHQIIKMCIERNGTPVKIDRETSCLYGMVK